MIGLGLGAALAVSDPVAVPPQIAGPDRIELRPIVEARVRFENVSQGNLDADALTLRLRAGAEARYGPFTLLAEGEATVALADHYNAFPFPGPPSRQRRSQYAVVADPETIELNRLQLQ